MYFFRERWAKACPSSMFRYQAKCSRQSTPTSQKVLPDPAHLKISVIKYVGRPLNIHRPRTSLLAMSQKRRRTKHQFMGKKHRQWLAHGSRVRLARPMNFPLHGSSGDQCWFYCSTKNRTSTYHYVAPFFKLLEKTCNPAICILHPLIMMHASSLCHCV